MQPRRSVIAIGLLLTLLVVGVSSAPAAETKIHPAVVRVVVPEGDMSTSYGSGTLVAASENTGLVLTNWHVVRDRKGQVEVVFPNGFRSAARVLRTDRDWDLAALLVWRPAVDPVPISTQVPRPGEVLSIAGYGKGNYRFATGRCSQYYLSPGDNLPADIVELSAGARQGDSGGPIFNQRGEMAGVLFGSASGKTSGSHAVRVRNFLSRIDPQLADGRLAPQPGRSGAQYAQNVTPGPRVASEYNPSRSSNQPPASPSSIKRQPEPRIGTAKVQPDDAPRQGTSSQASPSRLNPAPQWQRSENGAAARQNRSEQNSTGGSKIPAANAPSESTKPDATVEKQAASGYPGDLRHVSQEASTFQISRLGLWDHVKNVLCLIGGVAILVQVAKVLNPDDAKNKSRKKA